jgi:hypothetical protein
VVCAAGIVLAVRSRRPFHVLVGTAAAVAVAADVVTPYTAGGIGGPTLFPTQLRFLTLAAMLALLGGVLGAARRWLWLLPASAVVLLVVGALNLPDRAWVVAVALVAVGMVVVASRRPWSAAAARRAAVAVCVVGLLVAAPAVHWYDQHRYATDHAVGADAAYAYFRDVHHARVAVNAAMHTYPLSGPDLSNYAQTVGTPIRHGGFRVADSCATWQRLLRDGRYTFVVTGFAHHHTGTPPREQGWTERFPGARVVLRSGTTTVFRIDGSGPHAGRPPASGCLG